MQGDKNRMQGDKNLCPLPRGGYQNGKRQSNTGMLAVFDVRTHSPYDSKMVKSRKKGLTFRG